MHHLKALVYAWRHTILTLAYFALLALFVPIAQRHGMGTQGIFFSMLGAGLVLALIYWLIKLISHKMTSGALTGREVVSYMSGSAHAELALARETSGTAIIAIDPTTLPS